MDIFKLTKSKTKTKILRLFIKNPDQLFYLRQLAKLLHSSVGNIRRELITLTKINLFKSRRQGRLVYYKINRDSPFFQLIKTTLLKDSMEDIEKKALDWVQSPDPIEPDPLYYCQTRDVFSARLETIISKLEKNLKDLAFLLTAVIAEIGNNSFDHNLGNWPDIPGLFFACDFNAKKIVLADRGQGIYKTIKNVYPKVKNHLEALKIAFTKTISGRFPEKRGNGLKFVSKVLKENNWQIKFITGNAKLTLDKDNMMLSKSALIQGCLAVIKYEN